MDSGERTVTFDECTDHILNAVLHWKEPTWAVHLLPQPITVGAFLEKEPWANVPALLKDSAKDLPIWLAFVDYRPGEPWDHACRFILVADGDRSTRGHYDVHFPPVLLPEMRRVQ
jgi:hypothetical protein